MATKQLLRGAAAIAAVVALALALATIVAASSSSSSSPPQPAPEPPKQDWRVCEGGDVEKHALAVQSLAVDPLPIETGSPWSLDMQLKHRGHYEVREAEMTLKVFALKHVPVYSTTEDFCKSSKKKKGEEEGAAFVNMIAKAGGAGSSNDAGDAGKEGHDDDDQSGCPLKAGETTLLHFDGEWSAWAPESDKYVIRVVVVDRERPAPQNELLCVDIDVVARKPPSPSVVAAS
jgi:hypothetical protein